MIVLGDDTQKGFTVQVQIRGSNRLPNGKRHNTVNQITILDTTVEEVTGIIRAALEARVKREYGIPRGE